MVKPTEKVLYFKNIDALRFVLSLFVLASHIPAISNTIGLPSFGDYKFLQKGYHAVNWFFVLSGFLLSYLAQKETDDNRFSIKKFIIRRVLRIWPVYFIVTVIGISLYYFILPWMHIPFQNNASLLTTILLTFFFLSNILHRLYDPGVILTVTWSVSVEEQFYLLFPFLVKMYFKKRKRRIRSMFLLLFLVIIVDLIWPAPKGWMEYFGIYIELFLIGGLASELLPFFLRQNSKIKNLLLAASVFIFLFSFFTGVVNLDNSVVERITHGLLAAFVILTICTAEHNLQNRFLIMGGKISYGIYMYHGIVITAIIFIAKSFFYAAAWENPLAAILLLNILSVVLTYCCAYVSYRYIEKYFLSKKPY